MLERDTVAQVQFLLSSFFVPASTWYIYLDIVQPWVFLESAKAEWVKGILSGLEWGMGYCLFVVV